MAFNPGLSIGQILKNADLVETFKCGNMGGMRRSKTTEYSETLVRRLIEKITVHDEKLPVTFKSGLEIDVEK